MYRAFPWSSWTIPAEIVVETWVKNCTARVYSHSIGLRNYHLKSNFKLNLQKHHFVYVYEVIIKCSLNLTTCLYFPLALIRWNSNNCHLMELLKSKKNCKEKFDSDNNWKTAWPRMIFEWYLFLRLSLGFLWKMLSFVGKHLSFYPKDVCSFSAFFYLNEKELNQQVCLLKYVENEISNSTSLAKKEREDQKHNPTWKTFLKLLKKFR